MGKHKIVVGAVRQAVDTVKFAKGSIERDEYGARTVKNSGTTGGSISGAVVGATLGTTLVPGVGTTVGALVGGVVGSVAGSAAGRKIGQWIFLGDKTPSPEVLAVLNDPHAFDPAAHRPRFHPVPLASFTIDHHQTDTFLIAFAHKQHQYALILDFDRFTVEATLARQNTQRVRHSTGTVEFNRLSIPFHIGKDLVFEFQHGRPMFTTREPQNSEPARSTPFSVFKYV